DRVGSALNGDGRRTGRDRPSRPRQEFRKGKLATSWRLAPWSDGSLAPVWEDVVEHVYSGQDLVSVGAGVAEQDPGSWRAGAVVLGQRPDLDSVAKCLLGHLVVIDVGGEPAHEVQAAIRGLEADPVAELRGRLDQPLLSLGVE